VTIPLGRVIDISLELDTKTFRMNRYEGFARDAQFELEVLKDYPGGEGQIVRAVRMRLHAGSHVDSPSHWFPNGKEVNDFPLDIFIGDAVVANFSDATKGEAITPDDLESRIGNKLRPGDRLLFRTDHNNRFFEMSLREWTESSPYLTGDALQWCVDRGVCLVGCDFSHCKQAPDAKKEDDFEYRFAMHNVVTLTYLRGLHQITKDRVTLLAAPLAMKRVEASPVRALVIEN
jgi:arylformamidase